MARRRMIDPNFWESEDVARLNFFERLLLIGLFSQANDYGKGRASLTSIRSKIFPNDEINLGEIQAAITHIVLLILYLSCYIIIGKEVMLIWRKC